MKRKLASGDVCLSNGHTFYRLGDYVEAIQWFGKGLYWNNDIDCREMFTKTLDDIYFVGIDRKNHKRRISMGDARAMFLVGVCCVLGVGSYKVNLERAFELFLDAAEKNHATAQWWVGECLSNGYGTDVQPQAALEAYQEAALKKCTFAHMTLSDGYLYSRLGLTFNIYMSALYAKLGALIGDQLCAERFKELRRNFPDDIVPWNKWRPDPVIHSMVSAEIHLQIRTWLLIGNRLKIPHNVQLRIVEQIVTK